MKKLVSICIVAQAMVLGTNALASSVIEQPQASKQLINFDYKLYHEKRVLFSGSLTGFSSTPIIIQQDTVYRYISAVDAPHNSNDIKVERDPKNKVKNGVFLNILPVVHGNFISTQVSFEYSAHSGFEEGRNGLEMPDTRVVSIQRPLYFQSGELRAIDFCMKTQGCITPDYQLVIKASIRNPN